MSDNHTIRLVGAGWASFTGSFGQIAFEDGVSVRACTQREIDHLAAITRIETIEGDKVGIAHRLKGGATIPAEVKEPLPRQSDKAKAAEAVSEAKKEAGAPVEEKRYTVEELQAVADEKGLAGLREIATPRKLKGRSINDLVEAILKDQEDRMGKAPEAPADETPPAETPPAEGGESTETPAIEGEQDSNAQAAAALNQSQDA